MLNRGSDYYGYLTLLWRDEFDISDEESYGDFVFDRYDDTHIPEHTPIYKPGGELDYHKVAQPLWRLYPRSFWLVMNRKDHEGRCLNAYRTLRAVIPIIMLRRTQASVLEVNGQWIRIGDSIPPYRICTVELSWPSALAFQEYNKLFRDYVKYLNQGKPSDQGVLRFQVPGSGQGKSQVQKHGGARAFWLHRILSIMTFNPGLHKMLLRTGKKNLATHVHQWYEKFADKGMSYYFDLTKPERNLPLYADRFSMAKYLAKDSPKLLYLAKLMGEICLDTTDPKRTIIFADWPMVVWNIEGFLTVRLQTIV